MGGIPPTLYFFFVIYSLKVETQSKIKDAPARINLALEEKGYAIMMFSHWSSTEAGSGHALYVDIFSGDIDYDAKSNNHHVRAVCSF